MLVSITNNEDILVCMIVGGNILVNMKVGGIMLSHFELKVLYFLMLYVEHQIFLYALNNFNFFHAIRIA